MCYIFTIAKDLCCVIGGCLYETLNVALYFTETPMLEDADEGGIKLWHLVKPTDEPELPKHRRGSLRDRERAKAIPEIYLTRLLSMKVSGGSLDVSSS